MAHVRRGRLDVETQAGSLNLPRVYVVVDGEMAVVGVSYGNGASDPVVRVDLDLSGTAASRWVAAAYWWLRDRFAA